MARDASIRKSAEINNAKHFFDWTVSQKVEDQFKKDWEFIYAAENDYSEAEKLLQERFSNLVPIPGTQKYHSFIPKDERSIFASEFTDAHENQENTACFVLNTTKKRKSSGGSNQRQSSRLKN